MSASYGWKKAAAVCAVVLGLLLGTVSLVWAQGPGTGSITGTVKDPKGLAVPDAEVVVRNVDTGADRTLTTNSDGLFVAPYLQPGRYQVTAKKEGFADFVRKDLNLEVGQTLTVDAQMSIKTAQTTITVTSAPALLQTETTDVSQVISPQLVQNLPINGRRWESFALLTPGVTPDGGFGLISYRGISSLYNNNSVDGTDNTQAFFSESRGRTRIAYAYSQDTIQEFQVTASNYSPEFGRAAGGIVNAVTKSGTNDWHGDAYEYLRQFHTSALDSLTKSRGLTTKPELIRHQFGGGVGGPIIKDKFFFYGNYDGQRRSFPGSVITSNLGFFTSVATQANCLLASSTLTPAQCAAAIGFLQSLQGTFPRRGNQDIYFGKLDYKLNANNHLSASLNWHDWRGPSAFLTFTPLFSSVLNEGFDHVKTRFVVVDWNSVVKPTVVNNFRFQYGKDLEADDPTGPPPAVSIGGGGPLYGENQSLPRLRFPDERRWQATENISFLKGTHTIKTGFDLTANHEMLANLFQGNGNYSYSSFQNWVLDVFGINTTTVPTGKHYSNFVQAGDPITGIGADDFWNLNYGAYVQDTWKVRPSLTLNFGLRYELQHVPQPSRPNTGSPLLALYTSKINIDENNFGPRVGLAWQVQKKTVIRLGYGLYYGNTTNSTFYAVRTENGILQQTFNCGPTSTCAPTFPNVIFSPPGPPPAAPFPGALSPQVINTNPPVGVQVSHGLSRDFVNPLVHMGEVTVERELPWRVTVSSRYLFSRGNHLPTFVDTNLMPTSVTRTYDVVDGTGATLTQVTVPFYASRIDSNAGAILTGFSTLNSWYNAFVLSVHKQYSQGLELLANLTVSKAWDDGQVIGTNGTFSGTDAPIDPKNQKAEYALSDLDQRRRLVLSAAWFPPFHGIGNTAVRRIFDGLGFSGILTLADGQPVTGTFPFTPRGFCPSTLDGGVTCGEISSFGSPTAGRVPQLPRNFFTNPGLKVLDFRVQRDFSITERYKLRLLVEAFNIFNHTNVLSVQNDLSGIIPHSSSATSLCSTSLSASHQHVNNCIGPSPNNDFFLPATTTNSLYSARQLQGSIRFSF